MTRAIPIVCVLLLSAACVTPEPERTPVTAIELVETEVAADSAQMAVFNEVMAEAQQQQWHTLPFGEILQEVGVWFSGTPYVGGMLDAEPGEPLVVTLTSFDCVLLIETVMALAQGIAVEDYGYATFVGHLEALRYREGMRDGYCSRLHYFSEWIADNEARGTLEHITDDLGGEVLDKRLDFMSRNRDKYPRFAENDSLFAGVVDMEAEVRDLTLYHIPQAEINTVYDRLQAGDIIATSTYLDGLDVTHSGFVFEKGDGRIGFLHASTSGGVKVSPDLQRYVENNKVQIGIVVARPIDPRF
ncbi:MAG: N-acetylmuramoyl-L-alanine amidase-like domain-containing protein [Bacteroidota bacterium]